MPISMQELNRIVKLHGIIEGHKEHSHAAPTYKDSPYLSEMAELVLRRWDNDIETLEETIPALWYLTQAYDEMCRAGMSVKYYTPLLQAHTELMKLREYDIEDMEGLLYRTDYINKAEYQSLDSACTSIRVMLIASVNTEKETLQ